MPATAVIRPSTARLRLVRPQWRMDVVSAWLLAGGLVLYLAFNGGGYDIVVRSQVGLVVWWAIVILSAWGLFPAVRPTRAAALTIGTLGAFVVWTGLATTWSLSSERSLQELSRDVFYLGVLILAVGAHRDRKTGTRHTVAAAATAIVVVAGLAVASRLWPATFSGAQQTSAFLPGVQRRLNWPLDYWNGLAAFMAMGLPLLLSVAFSARRLVTRAAAAAGIPIVALCSYLTFSRGGLLEAVLAVAVFLALAEDRLPKLATTLVAAGGSAVLVAGAVDRVAIERGLTTPAVHHEAGGFAASIVLVCVAVGLFQAGLSLAERHGTRPRWLVVARRTSRIALATVVVAAVAIALAAGAPSRLSHAWQQFKQPKAAALTQTSIARYSSLSGNGRYDVWKVAVDSASHHLLDGTGPGTFQMVWLARAPYFSYIENAHSLYLETLEETGVIGLLLLLGAIIAVIAAGVRLAVRAHDETRTLAAGATAALVAFAVSAAFDWTWQLPVLPVTFLVLGGAALARPGRTGAPSARRSLATRLLAPLVGLVAIAAVAVPLATAADVRSSQAAAANGNLPLAYRDALSAAHVEPDAASPQIQLALVDELQRNYVAGAAAATRATALEPDNWTAWLIASRLDAEARRPAAALASYRQARHLNPRSPLFAR